MKFCIHYKYSANGSTHFKQLWVPEEKMFPQKGLMAIDQLTFSGFGLDVDMQYTTAFGETVEWIPPGQIERIEVIRDE